jgi:hypothetical protein
MPAQRIPLAAKIELVLMDLEFEIQFEVENTMADLDALEFEIQFEVENTMADLDAKNANPVFPHQRIVLFLHVLTPPLTKTTSPAADVSQHL